MEEGKGLIGYIHALERVITSRTGQYWAIKEGEKGNIFGRILSSIQVTQVKSRPLKNFNFVLLFCFTFTPGLTVTQTWL